MAVRWGAAVSPFVKQKHNCKESTLKNSNFNLQTFTSQNLEIPDLWIHMQLSVFLVQSMYWCRQASSRQAKGKLSSSCSTKQKTWTYTNIFLMQGRELGHWGKCWALGRAACYSLVFSLILSLRMRQRRQRAVIFMPATVPPRHSEARTAAFVPANAVLTPRGVQALRGQAAKASQGNKSRGKMFF